MLKKIKIIEDRKAFILAIGLLIIIWIFFSNYWHYPSPPIDSLTAKEVIRILEEEDSESGLMKIATENDFDWYICKGISCIDEEIFFPLSDRGWHKQGSIDKQDYYVQTFTKDQFAGNLGTTLKIEVYYSWLGKEDVFFLKIPQDVEF
ncbi:hypothetical protein [Solibacillus ferritrahens]|uniref:hypothetical protein n=1 Tax=Solibacillus ferritrahens TaxID=3098620 RepID=UPI003009F2D5